MTIKQKLQDFVKSAMGGETTPPVDPGQEPGTGGGLTDEILESLQSAIENGEVEIEESSIRSWGEGQGLSEDEISQIWSAISGSMDDDITPGPEGEEPSPDADYEKGNHSPQGFPQLKEFQKSLLGIKGTQEVAEAAIGALIDENQELRTELQSLKKEFQFMKSKLGSELKGAKDPVSNVGGIPSHKPKAEIIKQIRKGVEDKVLSLNDFHAYSVNGVETPAVKMFLKSQGGNN